MTKYVNFTPNELLDRAEGDSERTDDNPEDESVNPLKTTTLPIFESSLETHGPSAETGLVSRVSIEPEGKDMDDAQDAYPAMDDDIQPTTSAQAVYFIDPEHAPVVLIIEDTTELAEVIQATLERMNMKTAHETHGGKALAKLHELNPDVVLLDISLPDMTGWKILDTLKEEFDHGLRDRLPAVIVITAYGDPANRLVGKLQGVFSYLVKPFTSDEVENVVVQALSGTAQ